MGSGRRGGKAGSDAAQTEAIAAILNTFIVADLTDELSLSLTTPEGYVGATFELLDGNLVATI